MTTENVASSDTPIFDELQSNWPQTWADISLARKLMDDLTVPQVDPDEELDVDEDETTYQERHGTESTNDAPEETGTADLDVGLDDRAAHDEGAALAE